MKNLYINGRQQCNSILAFTTDEQGNKENNNKLDKIENDMKDTYGSTRLQAVDLSFIHTSVEGQSCHGREGKL